MILKNINKEIVNSKGEPISERSLPIDTMITILKTGRNVNDIINDLEKMKDEGEKATIKSVLERASLFQKSDKEQEADLVVKRFKLFQKITNANGEIDLSVDDVKTLRDNIAKSHTIIVAGQVIEALEAIGK